MPKCTQSRSRTRETHFQPRTKVSSERKRHVDRALDVCEGEKNTPMRARRRRIKSDLSGGAFRLIDWWEYIPYFFGRIASFHLFKFSRAYWKDYIGFCLLICYLSFSNLRCRSCGCGDEFGFDGISVYIISCVVFNEKRLWIFHVVVVFVEQLDSYGRWRHVTSFLDITCGFSF